MTQFRTNKYSIFNRFYWIDVNQYSVIIHHQSIIKEKDTSRTARTTAEVEKEKL